MKKKTWLKPAAAILAICFLGGAISGCGKDEPEPKSESGNPKVRFTVEKYGSFVIELYPEYAPATVENFLAYVNEGFYTGKIFHRVADDFMAQGGSPNGDGLSDPSQRTVKGEFSENGFTQNTLSHTRGIVSMARTNDPNSAGSQFFICYTDCRYSLDGKYAAFGKVVEGMEVVDAFLTAERVFPPNSIDQKPTSPVKPIVIASAEVIS
ncbi:MAG: peptidylprolyl isomerase [Oscillospiraceae bacterium]|nr:peptidylprolyl isomerase [Oscillospiraceae bacterium]